MNKESLENNQDRLTTTDAQGNRVYIYPADVKGKYRSARSFTQAILILLFLLLPWIHHRGEQLFFLDIAKRRFHFLGLVLWSHDAPILFLLFISIALSTAFVTAMWGRIWCGWACPQTVFIDGIYRAIERWMEGAPRARQELDRAPWTASKIIKKTFKYFLFLLVSLVITNSFLAYFVGSKEIFPMMLAPPTENWTSFLVIAFSTGIILFNFAWFREQFCTILCPYGRFQSVLMDTQSLIIGYDAKRGEPRRTIPPSTPQGDCVSCNRCVQACPTGIDIRKGLQMECIACTACIDACNEVMLKIKKPPGLIRYASEAEFQMKDRKFLRPRTIVYAGLLLVSLSALSLVLQKKEALAITILRGKDIPYQVVEQSTAYGNTKIVINHFKVDVDNQDNKEIRLLFSLQESDKQKGYELVMVENPLFINGSEAKKMDFFLRFPVNELHSGHGTVLLRQNILPDTKNAKETELSLVGPFF